jgi:hypothetical protein
MLSEKDILDKIGRKLELLRAAGLEDTQEYEDLSEEWQCLANNIIEGQLFDET